ncbi:MAG: alpha/beta hydrolase [Pseudomonadota bacterium]
MPLHKINGRMIHVDIFGDGEPLLAVHGLGGTSNFWWPFITAAQSRMRIVAPDMPSSGRSALDPDVSIESIAADFVALMDETGLEQAHLMGHSMGTIVCQHIAAQHPDRVRSLALVAPLAEPPEPARGALKDRAGLAKSDGMDPIATAILAAGLSDATRADNPVATGFVRELLMGQAPDAYAASCVALANAQAADVSAFSGPAMLVTGDEDKVAPPQNVEALAAKFSNVKSNTVLDKCGHWTLLERTTETLQLLDAFYAA